MNCKTCICDWCYFMGRDTNLTCSKHKEYTEVNIYSTTQNCSCGRILKPTLSITSSIKYT